MTVFIVIAALLMVGAIMFVVPSLIGTGDAKKRRVLRDEINLSVLRDQMRELDADLAAGTINLAGHQSAKAELERRVAEDVQEKVAQAVVAPSKPWSAALVSLSIPALAISLYFYLGTPAAFNALAVEAAQEAAQEAAPAVSPEQIAAMVAKLEQKLKESPDDADGWYMLARSNYVLKKYTQSADAYAKLVKLVPNDANLLANYADVLAMTQNQSLLGEPEKILNKALEIDPKNLKALALAGSAAFDRRDFTTAVLHWKKVLLLVPPESEAARAAAGGISQAQKLAAESGSLPSSMPTKIAPIEEDPVPVDAKAPMSVKGTVELDAAVRSKVSDTDTVFIFARASAGPKFPLAVLRKQVKDLPLSFTLDDSMSMMPNVKLSNFPLVVVGARISKSGNATAGVGDFEGVMEAVKPGATGLKIRINTERK